MHGAMAFGDSILSVRCQNQAHLLTLLQGCICQWLQRMSAGSDCLSHYWYYDHVTGITLNAIGLAIGLANFDVGIGVLGLLDWL